MKPMYIALIIIGLVLIVYGISGLSAPWTASEGGSMPSAKRAAPKDVAPLVYEGVRYTAPHAGILIGRDWGTGHVIAYDDATSKELWDKEVYPARYNYYPVGIEEDVFITQLAIERGVLVVTNERGERFLLDSKTGGPIQMPSNMKYRPYLAFFLIGIMLGLSMYGVGGLRAYSLTKHPSGCPLSSLYPRNGSPIIWVVNYSGTSAEQKLCQARSVTVNVLTGAMMLPLPPPLFVVRVFIKNPEGKLLVLRYGEMHPSVQWTVPNEVVQGYKPTPLLPGMMADINLFYNPIPSPEVQVETIARTQSGLSVTDVRLLDTRIPSDERIQWDYVAQAESEEVTLPEDAVTYYSEYRWVTKKELEELMARSPQDISLTPEELDMIFQTPATTLDDRELKGIAKAVYLAEQELARRHLGGRTFTKIDPVVGSQDQWVVYFDIPNTFDTGVWIKVDIRTKSILEVEVKGA